MTSANRRPSSGFELHIEELVVEGLPARHASRFEQALGGELQRLIQRHGEPAGLPRRHGERDIQAAPVRRALSDGPERMARRVARSVYEGLSGDLRGPRDHPDQRGESER